MSIFVGFFGGGGGGGAAIFAPVTVEADLVGELGRLSSTLLAPVSYSKLAAPAAPDLAISLAGVISTTVGLEPGALLTFGARAANAAGDAVERVLSIRAVGEAGEEPGEPEPEVPVMTTAPVASADGGSVGALVSLVSAGDYLPAAASYEYQVMRGSAAIAGAAGTFAPGDALPSYTTVAADDAALVRFRIVPIGDEGAGEPAYSNWAGPFVSAKIWYHRWTFSSSEAHVAAPYDLFNQARYAANVPVVGSSGLSLTLTGAGTWANDTSPTLPFFAGTVGMYAATRRFVLQAPADVPVRLRACLRNTAATTRTLEIWDGDPGTDGDAVLRQTIILPVMGSDVRATIDGASFSETASWASLTEDRCLDLAPSTRGNFTLRINDASASPILFYHLSLENVTSLADLAGAGVYYISAAGDDVNGDGSEANPWKHAPGTPGAGGIVEAFVPLPGAQIRWKRGEIHRPPSVAADQLAHLRMANGGTAGHPVTLGAYGVGAPAELRGTLPFTTGWAAPAGGSKAALSPMGLAGRVRQKAVANVHRAQHPVYADQKLYAAQWPYGFALSQSDNDDEATGWWRRGVVCSYTGADVDPDTGLAFTGIITDPALVARGTGVEHDLTGYSVVMAIVGNLLFERTILFHDRAAGTIKWHYAENGLRPYVNLSGSGSSCYCVRYSPFDLQREYQFAHDNPAAPTQLIVSLPAGHDTGLIEMTVLAAGVKLEVDYIEIEDDALAFRHFALTKALETAGGVQSSFAIHNTKPLPGVKLGRMVVRDFSSTPNLSNRRNVIGGDSKLQIAEVRGIDVFDCPTASVIRTGQESGEVSISNLRANNIGRTGLLIRGRNTVFTATDLCLNNINNRHGNAMSRYESGPIFGTVTGFSARNCQRCFTHYGADGFDSALTIRNFFMSPALADAVSEPIAYTGIIDYNGFSPGLGFEYGLAVGCGNAKGGYSVAEMLGAPGPGRPATQNIRRNMVVEGIMAIDGATDLSMYTYENVLVTKTSANIASVDDMRALGINIVNDSVVFVNQLWQGRITREMWEMLTRDGQTGNHKAVPIPGFGALQPFGSVLDREALTCKLNTLDRIPAYFPPNYTVGSIDGYLPCTDLSIDPADGDNAELGAILVKGDLQFTNVGPAGPKTLVVTLTPVAGAGYTWSSTAPKKVAIVLPVSGL